MCCAQLCLTLGNLWTVARQSMGFCPWDSPGKDTGVGCHALLQGIFPTQGSNPYLQQVLHHSQVFYPLSHLGSPGSSDGKGSACNAGEQGLIPGLGRSPGDRHSNSLQYSCLENPHGQTVGSQRVRHD